MCDLERPLNVIQDVCAGFGARCVRVDEVAVFSVHKRSIINLLLKLSSIRIEICSGIARFSLR